MGNEWKKILVEEFTTPSPLTINPGTTISEITTLMRNNGIRHLPVIDSGIPVGIISDRDVKLASSFANAKELRAEEIMSTNPYTVSPSTNLDEVAFEMSKNKFGCAIVQEDNGEIYGVFTSTDALNALIEILRGEI